MPEELVNSNGSMSKPPPMMPLSPIKARQFSGSRLYLTVLITGLPDEKSTTCNELSWPAKHNLVPELLHAAAVVQLLHVNSAFGYSSPKGT